MRFKLSNRAFARNEENLYHLLQIYKMIVFSIPPVYKNIMLVNSIR